MKENNLKMAQQDIEDALKTVEDLESFLNDPGLVALANRLTNARKQ